jgi:hypothetical protein
MSPPKQSRAEGRFNGKAPPKEIFEKQINFEKHTQNKPPEEENTDTIGHGSVLRKSPSMVYLHS